MYVTYHQNKTTSKLYKARNILNLISWSEGRKIWVKTNQSETENWMVRERERESWREGSPSHRMQQQEEARAITRRFPGSICVWEREKGEKRERAAADGASQAQSERERWKRGQRPHRCSRGWGKSRGGWPGSYGGASEPRWRRRWRTLPRGRDRRNCLY